MSKRLIYVHRILRLIYPRRYLSLPLDRQAGLSGKTSRIACCALCFFLCRTTDLLLGFLFLPAAPASTCTPSSPQLLPLRTSSGPSPPESSSRCSSGAGAAPWVAGCEVVDCEAATMEATLGLLPLPPSAMAWSSCRRSARSRIRFDAVTTGRSLANLLAPSGPACRCSLLALAASNLSAPPGCSSTHHVLSASYA